MEAVIAAAEFYDMTRGIHAFTLAFLKALAVSFLLYCVATCVSVAPICRECCSLRAHTPFPDPPKLAMGQNGPA